MTESDAESRVARSAEIVVRVARDGHERVRALEIADAVYRTAFYPGAGNDVTLFSYPLDVTLVAVQADAIVGTVGLFLARPDRPLPTEHLFGLTLDRPWQDLCEIGRLASTVRHAGFFDPLAAAAIVCMDVVRRPAAVVCSRRWLFDRLKDRGITVEPVPGSPIADRVPEPNRPYYLSADAPIAYLIHADVRTRAAIASWGVTVDLSGVPSVFHGEPA